VHLVHVGLLTPHY